MSENPFQRPYVISWNLTYRCNLACEHCYLDAGVAPQVEDESFADRRELGTDACRRIIDDIAAFAPESLTILTGGEPLLRRDILEIIEHAQVKKLWVVIGTNGVLVTERLGAILKEAGVRGMALSLDALDPDEHDRFRGVKGAWNNTVRGAKVLRDLEMSFIVQTTVGPGNVSQLEAIAKFAYEEMGAKVWNLFFLTPTGRGQFITDMTPQQYDAVLDQLHWIQNAYQGKMTVNAKCAPHYIKTLFEKDPESPYIKTYAGGAGGCPAGTHYLGIRPNGDVTPCPYLPKFGGNMTDVSLESIWNDSELFRRIRQRNELGQRCGKCEFNAACGGCRARAHGALGDYMAEDPLCTHQPGRFPDAAERLAEPSVSYGQSAEQTIQWTEAARDKMDQIPPFVRGMVVKSVESHCKKNGIREVTEEVLAEIRSRMPTGKIFGKRG